MAEFSGANSQPPGQAPVASAMAPAGPADRPPDPHRLAGVVSAGHVDGRDDLQQVGIRADRVGAEPLASVGIEIHDRAHVPLPSLGPSRRTRNRAIAALVALGCSSITM